MKIIKKNALAAPVVFRKSVKSKLFALARSSSFVAKSSALGELYEVSINVYRVSYKWCFKKAQRPGNNWEKIDGDCHALRNIRRGS